MRRAKRPAECSVESRIFSPCLPLLRFRLGEAGEEADRGLVRLTKIFPCLPCSVFASESGAKRPADGSVESPSFSSCLPVLRLRLGERGEVAGRGLGRFAEDLSLSLSMPSLLSLRLGEWGEGPAYGSDQSPRFTLCLSPLRLCLGEQDESPTLICLIIYFQKKLFEF